MEQMMTERTIMSERLEIGGKVKFRETVIRTDVFPEGSQVAREHVHGGRTLDLRPEGGYEKAVYHCGVEMPFLPSDVEKAIDEMEALVDDRIARFVKRRDEGKLAPPRQVTSNVRAKDGF